MAGDPPRRMYTVVATPADADNAWHITVAELPDSWTVAFSEDEIENRVRMRIALDTRLDLEEFDVEVRRVRRPAGG